MLFDILLNCERKCTADSCDNEILTRGSNVSISFILLPLRLRFVRLEQLFRAPRPVDSLLSLSSSYKDSIIYNIYI